jgi:integrase
VAYGAGLRASEVVALKVGDIDSKRMRIRVEQGKGRRDRDALLSPHLLADLRNWWKVARPPVWLFPNRLTPFDHVTPNSLNRAFHEAVRKVGIKKAVCLHTLRHNSESWIIPSGDHVGEDSPVYLGGWPALGSA